MTKVLKIYLPGEEYAIVDTIYLADGSTKVLKRLKGLPIPSKKNQQTALKSKTTGKMFIKHSDQYIKWQKRTKNFWEDQYLKLYAEKISLPIARCKVNIQFFFSDDRIRDSHNKWETIADALVDAGILADDCIQVSSDTSIKGFVCKNRPRTEIYITILTPQDEGYNYDVTDYEAVKRRESNYKKEWYQFQKLKKTITTTPH